MPSSGTGKFRTLIKVLNQPQLTWTIVDESTTWPNSYNLDQSHKGYQLRAPILHVDSLRFDVVTVLNFDGAASGWLSWPRPGSFLQWMGRLERASKRRASCSVLFPKRWWVGNFGRLPTL